MTINDLILLSSLLSTNIALAQASSGSIVLEGRGVSRSAPELVSVSILVTSICYNTSQEASHANAEVANQIIEIMKRFKQNESDRITATGGANIIQTESVQVGAESRVICERKWHSENQLRIEMTNMAGLPELQDQVLAAMKNSPGIDPNLGTQTYAEFARPEFHLSPESSQKMRQTAQVLAFDDAKLQLDTLSQRCGFKNIRLLRISPTEYSYVYKLAGERLPAYSTTPIIPDEMEVQATLRVEWQFDPTTDCRFR